MKMQKVKGGEKPLKKKNFQKKEWASSQKLKMETLFPVEKGAQPGTSKGSSSLKTIRGRETHTIPGTNLVSKGKK